MTAARSIHSSRAILIPIAIFTSCICLYFLAGKNHIPLFNKALLADLIISAPLLYWLAIRKSSSSKFAVLRVFVIGTLIAGYLISATDEPVIRILRQGIVPVIEIAVIGTLIRRFYLYRKDAPRQHDFLLYAREMLIKVTGSTKGGNIIAAEIAMLYYCVAPKTKQRASIQYFTNYRKNGLFITLGAVLFLFLTETTAMHFLLQLWSHTGAWIITGLSIYTCLQVLGHIRAVKARPIQLDRQELLLCNGLAGDVRISLAGISNVEQGRKVPEGSGVVKLALLGGLEQHNIILQLHEAVTVNRFFGKQQKAKTILFYVDEPGRFIEQVETLKNEYSGVDHQWVSQ